MEYDNEKDTVDGMLCSDYTNIETAFHDKIEKINIDINIGKGQIKFDISPNEIVAICGKPEVVKHIF